MVEEDMGLDYYFDIQEQTRGNNLFVLIIYDITNNKERLKLAKTLQGYGFRVQKSAFEAIISENKYCKLLSILPSFISGEDSIKVYKIIGKGQITEFGKKSDNIQDDIIII